MAWGRYDDDLYRHPKFEDAWERDKASGSIWLFAASYSAHFLTDGHVPRRFVQIWFDDRKEQRRTTDALVRSGLWVPNGNGWDFHDWRDYNEPSQAILARRAEKAKKREASRARRRA